eukprot:6999745-Prorocentrum_lima.AAC.1
MWQIVASTVPGLTSKRHTRAGGGGSPQSSKRVRGKLDQPRRGREPVSPIGGSRLGAPFEK